MPLENRTLPFTGSGDATASVAVDATAEGDVQAVKLAISVDGSPVLIPATIDGLLVQLNRLESPQDDILLASALSAGGNIDLDATDITSGKTGRLLGVDVGGSVPLRCDIQIVDGARVTRTTVYTREGETFQWRTPHVRFIEKVGGAGKRFGVSITNLDVNQAADGRATVYWDEVT